MTGPKVLTPCPTDQLQNVFIKPIVPLFGGTAVFSSNLSRMTNISSSLFGHISFGSNMPSFSKPANTKKPCTNNLCSEVQFIPDILQGKKATYPKHPNIPVNPDILKAVGLCRFGPKCYDAKSEMDCDLFDLGHLDWEE